jgi:hypothetical protein
MARMVGEITAAGERPAYTRRPPETGITCPVI